MKTQTRCKNLLLCGALAASSFAIGVSNADAAPATMNMKAADTELRPALDTNLDKLFMMHVAQDNMAEVAVGKLALTKTKNAGVVKVAQTIIAGHGAAQQDLAKIFQAKGMALPPNPGISNVATGEKLSKLSGAAFDKAFMEALVGAHEGAIVLFEHEIMAGKDVKVKAFASNKLPDIVGHTALIYTVAKQVGAPGIAMRPPAVLQAAMEGNTKMMAPSKMMPSKMAPASKSKMDAPGMGH